MRVIPPGISGEDLARMEGEAVVPKRRGRPPGSMAAKPRALKPAPKSPAPTPTVATSSPKPARRRGRPPAIAVGQVWRRGASRAQITLIADDQVCLGAVRTGNLITWVSRRELLTRWQREGGAER